MAIIIGSARHDENGKYSGGTAGDQDGTEVSTQNFYVHSKGWYIIRAKSDTHANSLASLMQKACNNSKIGYDQGNRLGIIKYGISTTTATECDCSSLVRQCVIEATGTDPGNFTTANAVTKLTATGLFEDKVKYVSSTKTPLENGDILCTCSKGHIVIVVSGATARGTTNSNTNSNYSKTQFIKDVQSAIGAKVDGIAGNETLSKTVTLSAKKNSKHAAVLPVQKYLYALGYTSVGTADGEAGAKFTKATKEFQTDNGCTVDGEITAKAKTWKKLLGLA